MRFTIVWRGAMAAALAVGAVVFGAPVGLAAPGEQMHAGSFCGGTPDMPASSPTTTPISASVGVPFSITLDSNPTTGYSWALATQLDPNVVDLLHHSYHRASGGMGAGGQELWTFEPLCTGFTTIVLRYRRPWEPNDPTDRQMAYDIYVR